MIDLGHFGLGLASSFLVLEINNPTEVLVRIKERHRAKLRERVVDPGRFASL